MQRVPFIGITAALSSESRLMFNVNEDYVRNIVRAGGNPILLPPFGNTNDIANKIDALLLPGGGDVSPLFYGEEPMKQTKSICHHLDLFEHHLLHQMIKTGKPVLGICRGMQIINTALGGSLYQDIPTQLPDAIEHYQDIEFRHEPFHVVHFLQDSILQKIFKSDKLQVNSFHHQAVKKVAPDLRAVAFTTDGIIEAIEGYSGYVLGVQWHPETMTQYSPLQFLIFNYLVNLASFAQ